MKDNKTKIAPVSANPLDRLVIWLRCLVKHDLVKVRNVSNQACLVWCKRCGKNFVYKHSGDFQGALLPWTLETEEFYKNMNKFFNI